jgi:hypothetical protein
MRARNERNKKKGMDGKGTSGLQKNQNMIEVNRPRVRMPHDCLTRIKEKVTEAGFSGTIPTGGAKARRPVPGLLGWLLQT